jgi:2-C-methyl-D-erythritol 4-phosphate cytidylyltransferase
MVENKQDALVRAYATLSSLRKNIMSSDFSERYVHEYHAMLDRLEGIGIEISEFRIPTSEVNPRVISINTLTGETSYSKEKYVSKAFILKVGAVIVAAGESHRMGGVDKVFALLGGKPVLARVIDAFQGCNSIDQIVVVVTRENLDRCRQLVAEEGWSKPIEVCAGGRRRQDSVAAGLSRLSQCQWVVVHDGARPLLTADLIERGLEAAGETGAAVAAVPVTDTVKVAGDDRIVQQTPPRHNLWAVQTPQVFRFDIITEAYRQAEDEVTDDASLVEQLGYKVKLYMGSYDNIKITTPDDLALAEVLWQKHEK